VKARSILVVAAFALMSCKSDKNTGPSGLAGQLSFNYSGALSGTFNVTGEAPASQTGQETSSWAAGEVINSGTDAGIYVVGSTPRTASSHDLVFIVANRTNAGTSTIDFDACESGTADVCSTVFFLFGLSNGTNSSFLQDCWLQSGTITITEVTSTRMRGTFSGAGQCFTSGGTMTVFTVSNGTFDVAIVPGVS
jgi:hypothetical protein